jgi:hypothetical protein
VEILVVALDVAGAGDAAPPSGPGVLDFSEQLPVQAAGASIEEVLEGG